MALVGVTLEEEMDLFSGRNPTIAGGLAFGPDDGNETALPNGWEGMPQFDRYVLLLPPDLADRSELLRRFYDFIAPDFERLADRMRNVENIRYLFSELELRCGPLRGRLVLDLGSGTGLSVDVALERDIEILGVETSSAMASVAGSRGMHVVAPAGLSALPQAAGAISSYVLHFGIPPETLRAVLGHLAPSGVLLGNVHHGTNLQRLAEATSAAGGQLSTWTPPGRYQRHGIYVAISH